MPSILEILEAHKVSAFAGSDTACSCDRTWRTNDEYRAHVAQVLDQHMREREAQAWELGCDAEFGRDVLGRAKEPNPYRKEPSDGR